MDECTQGDGCCLSRIISEPLRVVVTPSKRYSLLSSDLGDFFVRTLLALILAVALAGCSVQPRLEGGVWSSDSDAIDAYYQQWQGTPYRRGGTDERGLDCSAFVQNLFSE